MLLLNSRVWPTLNMLAYPNFQLKPWRTVATIPLQRIYETHSSPGQSFIISWWTLPTKNRTPSCCTPKFYERGKIDVIEKHLCKSNFSNPINKKANFHCFTSQDNLAILYMLQPPRKTVANVQHKRPLERTNR